MVKIVPEQVFQGVALGLIEPSCAYEINFIKEAQRRGYSLRASSSPAIRLGFDSWIVWRKSVCVAQGSLQQCIRYIYEQTCDINNTLDTQV